MKLGVLVGEDMNGRWHPVALPDKAVQDQRAAMKAIKAANGVVEIGKKSVQLKRAIFFDAYTRRAFFRHDTKPADVGPAGPPAIT